ncbi:nuclear pore complex protein Nup214 isoform X3 [Oryzias melastigma]|uniref:Nucleoporin 214 n=1 Tax=Oryzias melastigma TaxID=30732 RepID=A0A3B3BGU9_ORYME|nr:nuclear pore complex protein Nup214 isoform X3 [Oryzias melastigma]
MSDDADSPPERLMKDFQFRQLNKVEVFKPPDQLPKDRSSLLTVSNKYGLTFVGLGRTFKVYLTKDILCADKADPGCIVKGTPALATVTVELALHHLALSCDELTLSVCGVAEENLCLTFYDVRTFINGKSTQKLPFASFRPDVQPGTLLQDLKWNPAHVSMLAACLSDGSMMILDVADLVKVQAKLPSTSGITCICWSPKGKQVAAGKMNGTVSQYTPALEEKKVIPCPPFYTSEDPVKALDVLWLRTFAFAVTYAAADGSLETPPELVLVSLPKKDEKVDTKYLNFGDIVYGTCTERQHHYFLSHIEDWDLVFAASAASIEVSVIARQDDKMWELWILEDASRAELRVTESNEDTLPLGLVIDYTSQQEIYITDEKTLPPAPTLMMLSTEGLLCSFALVNQNPGVKQLITPPTALSPEGERLPKPGSLASAPAKLPAAVPAAPAAFPSISFASTAMPSLPVPSAPSSITPFSIAPTAPVTTASSGFTFSVPPTFSTTSAPVAAFSLGGSAPFGSGSSGFSFASKPSFETPSALPTFPFSSPSSKPPVVAAPVAAAPSATAPPQGLSTASPPTVKQNLNERFSGVEASSPAFSFPKAVVSSSSGFMSASKPPAVLAPVHPVQTSTPPAVVQKPAPAVQGRVSTQQQAVSVKALEKQLQQKKDSDPIMAGILEEIAHFQKELDDLKGRSSKGDVRVGTNDEMKELRKESEDLHIFTLEIRETTESLHGDISTLKTTLLEGFAGAEEAKTQNELGKDKNYRQLLYKKPLDPRSEEQLKEIRRLYQYVKFAVEDVNDVLDVEWEKHLEKKKKQKHMVVPGREGLFNTLSSNLCIINQQKNRLDQLIQELSALRLYSKTTAPTINQNTAATTSEDYKNELENLEEALLKARLDKTPPETKVKSSVKISPVKQSQLRNFLSKGQMPPVRSTAPANLSRSAFLAPKSFEDLDDVSSTSSLSQSIELLPSHLELEEEEELQPLQPPLMNAMTQSLPTPRHPAVVRTPSIQPGFGAIQSTPLAKMHPVVAGMGFGLSPIVNPVPTNRINLSGAESTALATKTVKHGAPPTERSVPVTISAQQAAATAALRRQMASQKPAAVNASLTESTLKTVPQVVNVQELKDKGPPMPMSSIISSSAPDPSVQGFTAVSASQVKRNTTPGLQKLSTENGSIPQTGFVFGQPSKTEVSVVPPSSVEQNTSKAFSFTSGSAGFSFSSVTQGAGVSQVKDVSKFSFGGNGKGLFGQPGEEPFSLPTKSNSPGLSTGSSSSSANSLGEVAKPASSVAGSKAEPQPPKVAGGETLGSFSGLRVGQGEEGAELSTKAAPAFTFGNAGLGHSKSAPQFSFGSAPQKSAEDGAAADLPKVSGSGSLFKPPDSNSMPTFSITPSTSAASALPTSLSSLLAAPTEESQQPSESTPAALPEPSTKEPAVDLTSAPADPEPPVTAATTTSAAPTLPVVTPVPTADSSTAAPAEPESIPPSAPPPPAPSTEEATPDPSSTPSVPTSAAAVPLTTQVTSAAAPAPSSDKPGSIFTSVAPATTTSGSVGAIPAINTAAPSTTTTATGAVITSAPTTAANVFGQPPAPPATSAPATTGFGTSGFGAPAEAGFGKSVFSVGGFGQPASIGGTSSGFSFTQSAFGASSSSATTGGGGGGLFGAPTVTNASSFSFGTSSSSTPSSTGLFGQNTTPAFGQTSGFGQGSLFRNNTTTSSASGFSFQPSGFGCSAATPVFGSQSTTGGLFGQQQQPSTGGGLFGQSSTSAASSPSGGFFSGLGGKPSEDAANKNPFGTTASTGVFGQSTQTGANSLFGSSGAKAFGFGGQPAFGDQKPSGTFSTGGGSVASQGFGSFSTPSKSTSGFGSAPVFGSPPSFGGSPAFGGGASFSSSPSFSNPLPSSSGKVFGEGTAAASMGGFGFSSPPSAPSFGAMATQTAPSFGSLAQQGSGFGSQPSSFSGFGQQPQTGGFSGNAFGSPNPPGAPSFGSWRS